MSLSLYLFSINHRLAQHAYILSDSTLWPYEIERVKDTRCVFARLTCVPNQNQHTTLRVSRANYDNNTIPSEGESIDLRFINDFVGGKIQCY